MSASLPVTIPVIFSMKALSKVFPERGKLAITTASGCICPQAPLKKCKSGNYVTSSLDLKKAQYFSHSQLGPLS